MKITNEIYFYATEDIVGPTLNKTLYVYDDTEVKMFIFIDSVNKWRLYPAYLNRRFESDFLSNLSPSDLELDAIVNWFCAAPLDVGISFNELFYPDVTNET